MMKFEKRNFMGIELDVLVGHPEHDLLFLATQVLNKVGYAEGKRQVTRLATNAKRDGHALQVCSMVDNYATLRPAGIHAPTWASTWLFDEPALYDLMLRGRAPQAAPFRKWVTEEVLPTIRKTGKYDAEQSTNPIAMGVMDELKALRGEVSELKSLIQGLSLGQPVTSVKSPYEGVTKGTVWYHKDVQAIRKAGDTLRLTAPVVDRYTPHLLIQLEKNLIAKWRANDSRQLDCEFSSNGARNWTLWPMDFLKSNLMHTHIVEALTAVINERLNK